jgi:ribosomal protein S18 acetylase RimI-like enzyme
VQRSSDFDEGMSWARQLLGEPNVPRVWIPKLAFVEAVRTGENLSFTRKTSEGFFGLAIGPEPILLTEWNEFAIPQSAAQSIAAKYIFQDDWETHAIEVISQSYEIELIDDDDVITEFLNMHAPKSSAKPGNPEIQFWGCVRNDEGEIAAIAAITQWESEEYMLSSVATHTRMRGQGFAQKVCAGLVGLSYDRGIERLHLVVLSSNAAAIHAYSRIGFNLIGKFASYSK